MFISNFIRKSKNIINGGDNEGCRDKLRIIQKECDKLKRENRKLKSNLGKDSLTGLSDYKSEFGRVAFRRLFEKCKRDYENGSSKKGKDFCYVVFIDLLKFKSINDTYGHGVGDTALIAVSNAISKSLRLYDVRATFNRNNKDSSGFYKNGVSRAGGDEFILGLADLNEDCLPRLFKRIINNYKKEISKQNKQFEDSLENKIGLNFGVVRFNKNLMSVDEWVDEADKRMYKAKGFANDKGVFDENGGVVSSYVIDDGDPKFV